MIPKQIGRYQVIEQISQTSMASVYRAHDPSIGREVAIKVLPSHLLQDATYRTRFNREARIVAAMDHPAIVPIFDFGEVNDQPYLVMRYMSGGTLADKLDNGALPIEEAVDILVRLANALHEVHQADVIHRDLKPSNVLFDHRDSAALTDFGVVKLLTADETVTSSAVGTPAYMSPEQIEVGDEVSERSDVYALGVLLFEMLTGKRPFTGGTSAEVMMSHVNDPIPKMRDLDPTIPEALEAIATKSLAKSPSERFGTAQEFARALTAVFGKNQKGSARLLYALQPKRFRLFATLGCLSAIVAIGLLGWLAFSYRTELNGIVRGQSATATSQSIASVTAIASVREETEQTATAQSATREQAELATETVQPTATNPQPTITVAALDTLTATPSPSQAPPATATEESTAASGTSSTADPTATAESTVPTDPTATATLPATATDEPTATATSEPTVTPTPSPTATTPADRFNILLDEGRSNPILFRQDQGRVQAAPNASTNERGTGWTVRDFVAEVEFSNPAADEFTPWDSGIRFRASDSGSYHLVIFSSNAWQLYDETATSFSLIDGGEFSDLRNFGGNKVTLVAAGLTGGIYLNDEFVSELDLSDRLDASDVWVTRGFNSEGETAEFIEYQQFTLQPAESDLDDLQSTIDERDVVDALGGQYEQEARQVDPIFAIPSGNMLHGGNVDPERISSGVDLRNFLLEVVFEVPYNLELGEWDVGVIFREDQSSDYRLLMKENGQWQLIERQQDTFSLTQEGWLPNFNTGIGDVNRLKLIVRNDQGFFYLNGILVSELDISGIRLAGDVSLATGIVENHKLAGQITRFTDFSLWILSP